MENDTNSLDVNSLKINGITIIEPSQHIENYYHKQSNFKTNTDVDIYARHIDAHGYIGKHITSINIVSGVVDIEEK